MGGLGRGIARGCGRAGRTGRHLLRAANGRKLFLKNHVKIQIVISYVCVQKKQSITAAARTYPEYPGSLAASGSTLLVLRQFCVGAGLYRILVRFFLR